ncbi:Steroid_dh-domain-containing protein [Fragilariopsis cylindrus CCMP1102]|uniref:Steroid_dh-domain-containing protein n=1 Tax=Fragilariopsis cylindrus CCMP1102 TaxID=635003 RepID=A0A1E7EYH3_9STRA|nr:Steroid_dh-domain-containing protein [Fragilariopsis cylindrus CCMP1102]|eukprot:OEU10879.1 Steroid_dh-domain-containing protein [Fragilariopsis cylindrus CCMP1102]
MSSDADATTDTKHNTALPSSSSPTSSTLRQRRKSNSNNHDDAVNEEEEEEPQKQKKQKRHWLGPLIPSKLAWFLFESPCWIWVLVCCLYDCHNNNNNIKNVSDATFVSGLLVLPFKNQLLLGWFFFHYIYRSILYPFMMTTTITPGGGIPFGIAFMAFLYCFINGYLQSKYLTRLYFGIVLIIIGFSIVFTSDRILLNLKKQQLRKKRMNSHTSHYSIPYGGLFYLVSSPHYFGELLEWIGFCIASNYSLCSSSFVVWTAANLIPRSIHTHNWYKNTFQNDNHHHDSNNNDDVVDDDDEDWVVVDVNYSDLNRKAIIPFIL